MRPPSPPTTTLAGSGGSGAAAGVGAAAAGAAGAGGATGAAPLAAGFAAVGAFAAPLPAQAVRSTVAISRPSQAGAARHGADGVRMIDSSLRRPRARVPRSPSAGLAR